MNRWNGPSNGRIRLLYPHRLMKKYQDKNIVFCRCQPQNAPKIKLVTGQCSPQYVKYLAQWVSVWRSIPFMQRAVLTQHRPYFPVRTPTDACTPSQSNIQLSSDMSTCSHSFSSMKPAEQWVQAPSQMKPFPSEVMLRVFLV